MSLREVLEEKQIIKSRYLKNSIMTPLSINFVPFVVNTGFNFATLAPLCGQITVTLRIIYFVPFVVNLRGLSS